MALSGVMVMDLAIEVEKKNSQLLLQRVLLQQQLAMRSNRAQRTSFLLLLVVEPFLVGLFAQRYLGFSGALLHKYCRLIFPSLNFWSIF